MKSKYRLLSAATLTLGLAAASATEAQDPIRIDESYTTYSIARVTQIPEGDQRNAAWQLAPQIRVFGRTFTARKNAFRWVLKQGNRVIAERRCASSWQDEDHRRGVGPDMPVLAVRSLANCTNETPIRETGEFTVEWTHIDTNTDVETPLGSHRIVVRTAPVYSRSGTEFTPTFPRFYVDWHGELLSSVIVQAPADGGFPPPPIIRSGRQIELRNEENVFMLVFTSAVREQRDAIDTTTLRCRIDGNLLDLGTHDRISYVGTSTSYAVAELPGEPGGQPVQDVVRFERYTALLPMTGANASLAPGAWQCDIRNRDAETLRTFRFTVGSDGQVVPHAEETEGGLTLPPGTHLVESVIPESARLDARTDPSALSRAFWGRGFRSAAGHALAGTLRALGQPYPPDTARIGRGGAAAGARAGAGSAGGRGSRSGRTR